MIAPEIAGDPIRSNSGMNVLPIGERFRNNGYSRDDDVTRIFHLLVCVGMQKRIYFDKNAWNLSYEDE